MIVHGTAAAHHGDSLVQPAGRSLSLSPRTLLRTVRVRERARRGDSGFSSPPLCYIEVLVTLLQCPRCTCVYTWSQSLASSDSNTVARRHCLSLVPSPARLCVCAMRRVVLGVHHPPCTSPPDTYAAQHLHTSPLDTYAAYGLAVNSAPVQAEGAIGEDPVSSGLLGSASAQDELLPEEWQNAMYAYQEYKKDIISLQALALELDEVTEPTHINDYCHVCCSPSPSHCHSALTVTVTLRSPPLSEAHRFTVYVFTTARVLLS